MTYPSALLHVNSQLIPHHYTIRHILLFDQFYGEGNRFKEVSYSSLVSMTDRVKLAGETDPRFGPGQRTCRIKSFSKLHIYSSRGLECPDSQRAKDKSPCETDNKHCPIPNPHWAPSEQCSAASVIPCLAQAGTRQALESVSPSQVWLPGEASVPMSGGDS